MKISVIIPLFNGRLDIVETIESVIDQTYKNFEIIVIDDGSTDGSFDVIKSYIDNEQITYIFQENQGVAAARNRGIEAAKGDYIAFLDKDDIWLPKKLENQVETIKKYHAEAAYCGFIDWFKENNSKSERKSLFLQGNILREYLQNKIYIQTSTFMVSKDVLNRYKINFTEGESWGEDLEFFVKVLSSCKVAGISSYDVLYKKDTSNSLSSQYGNIQLNLKAVDMWLRLRDWLKNLGNIEAVKILDGYRLPQVIVGIYLNSDAALEKDFKDLYLEKYRKYVKKQTLHTNGLRSIKCYIQTKKLEKMILK